jgi:hypothetical protein
MQLASSRPELWVQTREHFDWQHVWQTSSSRYPLVSPQWVQTVSAPAQRFVPAGVPPAAAQWGGLLATLAGAGLALWLLFKV